MLDDPALRERVDPSGFWRLIAGLPEQAQAAWALGLAWRPPESFRRPSRVVVLGMGGSAIGGDIVATVASRLSPVPVEVVRDYVAPPCDEGTLLVACSFSGNTEEVLTAFSAQLGGPGMRLALTTGGQLAARAAVAEERGVSLLRYDFEGPPRSALGYGVFLLVAVLQRLDALTVQAGAIEGALRGLEQSRDAWGPDTPADSNLAKQIATRVQGRLPLIVGADVLAVAARRWAGDILENAKQWAFAAALPEADHNLLVGFGRPPEASRHVHALLLDGPVVHARNRLRVELTARELDAAGVSHEVVELAGEHPLEALLRACSLGSWVSYYLALLNGVDPLLTPELDRFKEAMARQPVGGPQP